MTIGMIGRIGMTKETGTPPDWARICSEIVVAAYGTRIVGEKDGWPLCIYPLEECRDDGSGTLHTYYYRLVPRYHEGEGLYGKLIWHLRRRGWEFGARHYAYHCIAYVNKAGSKRLRKDSITAKASTYWEATTLAIYKALMEEGE